MISHVLFWGWVLMVKHLGCIFILEGKSPVFPLRHWWTGRALLLELVCLKKRTKRRKKQQISCMSSWAFRSCSSSLEQCSSLIIYYPRTELHSPMITYLNPLPPENGSTFMYWTNFYLTSPAPYLNPPLHTTGHSQTCEKEPHWQNPSWTFLLNLSLPCRPPVDLLLTWVCFLSAALLQQTCCLYKQEWKLQKRKKFLPLAVRLMVSCGQIEQ